MVKSFSWVKKLKEKYYSEEEISVSEVRKLEKYVTRKQKMTDVSGADWSKKQLLKAERLLEELKQEKGLTMEVEN